jgi:hypothetical protein
MQLLFMFSFLYMYFFTKRPVDCIDEGEKSIKKEPHNLIQ